MMLISDVRQALRFYRREPLLAGAMLVTLTLALGDTHGGIVSLIVRSLTAVIGGGIAAGLVLALALGRTVSTLVYGIDLVDPLSYASAVIGFALIVLITGAASASRASAVEAAIALRAE
jgi:hypothetical protein